MDEAVPGGECVACPDPVDPAMPMGSIDFLTCSCAPGFWLFRGTNARPGACVPCPLGSVEGSTSPGAIDPSFCQCQPGSWLDIPRGDPLGARCVKCPQNSVKALPAQGTSVAECQCKPGFYLDTAVPDGYCRPCPAPYDESVMFGPPASISECKCAAGHWLHISGPHTGRCVRCPYNSVPTLPMAGAVDPAGCRCAAGFFLDLTHNPLLSQCVPCPPNADPSMPVPEDNAHDISACNAASGYWLDVAAGMVHPCPDPVSPDMPLGATSHTACWCADGYWLHDIGDPLLAECIACPMNSVPRVPAAPAISPTQCACADGFWLEAVVSPEKALCVSCPVFSDATTSSAASIADCACQNGFYMDLSQPQGRCVQCPQPVDLSLMSPGATHVSACACAAGYWLDMGQTSNERCVPCPLNSVADPLPPAGSTSPANCQCEAGFWLRTDLDGIPAEPSCVLCPIGSVPGLPERGSLSPADCVCASGRYLDLTGPFPVCAACPEPCAAGLPQGLTKPAQCQCAPGYWMSDYGTAMCKPCPVHSLPGVPEAGASSPDECRCAPGFWLSVDGHHTMCVECPIHSIPGVPSGHSTNAADCQCRTGYFMHHDIYTNHFSCVACPTPHDTALSAPGATGISECACASGYWLHLNVNNPGASQCVRCPHNTASTAASASSPYECYCAGGHYLQVNEANPLSAECVRCPSGSDISLSEAGGISFSSCVCMSGYFRSDSTAECLPCPAPADLSPTASEMQATSMSQCSCAAGYWLDTELGVCHACPRASDPASFVPGASDPSQCVCMAGHWLEMVHVPGLSGPGMVSCVRCPDFSVLEDTLPGATSVDQCSCRAGWWLDTSTPHGTCRECPHGTDLDASPSGATNSWQCVCAAGHWMNTHTEACDPCPLNSVPGIPSVPGSASPADCKCRPQFWLLAVDHPPSARCMPCPAHSDPDLYNPSAHAPTACACRSGFWMDLSAPEGRCIQCPGPVDSSAMAPGATSPHQCTCSAGFYLNSDMTQCLPCPARSILAKTGPGSNSPHQCVCEAGHWLEVDERGIPHCIACPEHSIAGIPEAGATGPGQCLCRPGHYADPTGSICLACPGPCDLSLMDAGAKSPHQCICSEGHWLDASNQRSPVCVRCPFGSDPTVPPSGATQPHGCSCLAGMWLDLDVDNPARSRCVQCPLHALPDIPSGGGQSVSECVCSEGFYLDTSGPGDGSCNACPGPAHKLTAGLTSAHQCRCAAGHWMYTDPAGTLPHSCVRCPLNSFLVFLEDDRPATSPDLCTCQANHWLDLSQGPLSAQCVQCPANSIPSPGGTGAISLTECVCAPGFYLSTLPREGACLACPLRSTSPAGSISPDACACDMGQYLSISAAGIPDCLPCPHPHDDALTSKGATSPSDCVCAAGFYLDLSSAVPVCLACPSGSSSPPGSTALSDCSCLPGAIPTGAGSCSMCADDHSVDPPLCFFTPQPEGLPADTDCVVSAALCTCQPCPEGSCTVPSMPSSQLSDCFCTAGYQSPTGKPPCTPVCQPACDLEHGAVCTSPNQCRCPFGYFPGPATVEIPCEPNCNTLPSGPCAANAVCTGTGSLVSCECAPNYIGDGLLHGQGCQPDCTVVFGKQCHPLAVCKIDASTGSQAGLPYCLCPAGMLGDGTAGGTGCSAVCGNSIVEFGEVCDDGNIKDGDGCDADCLLEECGNGVVQGGAGEQCEPALPAPRLSDGTPLQCSDSCHILDTCNALSELDSAHVELTVPSLLRCGMLTPAGTMCTFQCQNGYEAVSGSTTRTCQAGPDGVGTFTGLPLSCAADTCNALTVLGGASVELDTTVSSASACSDKTTQGTTCTWRCRLGYQPFAGQASLVCSPRGDWDGSPLQCAPVQCNSLTAVPSGYGSLLAPGELGCKPGDNGLGQNCRWVCPPQQYQVSGDSVRTCGLNGEFSGEPLMCEARCDGPADTLGTHTEVAPGYPAECAGMASPGTQCLWVCNAGYEPRVGSQIQPRECLSTGQFGGLLLQCRAATCDATIPVPNAFLSSGQAECEQVTEPGILCEWKCHASFTAVSTIGHDVHTRVCGEGGEFVGEPLLCVPQTCDVFAEVHRRLAEVAPAQPWCFDQTEVGRVCQFQCQLNNERESGDLVRECQSDGTWGGDPLICRPVSCNMLLEISPGVIPNAADTLACGPSTQVGTSCGFECDYGFVRQSGDIYRTCLPGGVWSGEPLKCQGTCDASDVLPSSYTTLASGFSGACTSQTPPWTECLWQCLPGYRPFRGDEITRRVCDPADGSFTGVDLVCVAVGCDVSVADPSSELVSSADICSPDTAVGSRCEWRCREPLISELVSGDAVRECKPGGSWTGSPLLCRPKTCSVNQVYHFC